MKTRLVMSAMRRDLERRAGIGGGCSLGVDRGRDREAGADFIFHKSGIQEKTVSYKI